MEIGDIITAIGLFIAYTWQLEKNTTNIDVTNVIYILIKVKIEGGASLSMSGSGVQMTTSQFAGDKSGRLTVRSSQVFQMTDERLYLPSALLTQQDSEVNLPTKIDCRAVDVIYKG